MMSKCDIIVTYCWNRVGYNILKSLSSRGLKVVVADTSTNNICSKSKFAFSSFSYPDPFSDEKDFILRLLEKVEYYKPHVLLPTHDEGLIIAKYRSVFPKDLIIPIDSYEKIVSISDKEQASKLAQNLKIPTPLFYSYNDEIKLFPIVFKTKIGNSAKGVFFPSSIDELNRLKEKYLEEDVLLQEYVKGVDHSVDCLRKGDFFFATVYRALVTKTHGGGTTTQRIIVDLPILCEYAHKMLDDINYNGVCGFDFKYDKETGRIAFIEVNARYTGGLATPIAAGFDIPYLHYLLSTDSKVDTQGISVKIGTKTKWILGDIITLIERILTFSLKMSDLKAILNFKFDAFDDFNKNDKKAFWGECLYYFHKLIKNRKLNP